MNETNYTNSDYAPCCTGVKRGGIWKVDTVNRAGEHVIIPMIIVSQEQENNSKPYVIAIKIHDSVVGRPRPSRFSVNFNGTSAFAICETMHRVNGERLMEYVGRLTDDEYRKLNEGMCYAVGMNGEDLAQFVASDITHELYRAIDTAEQEEASDMEKIKFERDFYKTKYEELLSSLTVTTTTGVHSESDFAPRPATEFVGGYTQRNTSNQTPPPQHKPQGYINYQNPFQGKYSARGGY